MPVFVSLVTWVTYWNGVACIDIQEVGQTVVRLRDIGRMYMEVRRMFTLTWLQAG